MAISSRLKTADGKYYATEEYVDKQLAEGIDTSEIADIIVEKSGDKIADSIKSEIIEEVEEKTSEMNNSITEIKEQSTALQSTISDIELEKADKDTVYTKEEVEILIQNYYSFNTL